MAQPQLSLTLITFSADDPDGWDHLRRRAEIADAAGVDRLAVSDHIAFGPSLEAYGDPAKGGISGGRQPTGPDGHWLEPLTVISHLTAATSRVRFVTNILLAALRRPAVLAKTLSTIDVLSAGRIDVGVGVGWQAAEYEAAGLDFATRGAQLDHTLHVCQTLWSGDPEAFDDDRLRFDQITQRPRPIRAEGVPVWVSGTVNPRSMRRLARFGSGWIPWGGDAADLARSIPAMREAVERHGGDPAGLGVVGSLPTVTDADGNTDVAATMGAVPALAEAGVTDFRSNFRPTDDAAGEDALGDLVAAFRRAAD